MNTEPEALFDLAAEMDAVLRSQDIARRMGKNQMGQKVHGWIAKWSHHLPLIAMEELIKIIKDES